MNDSILKVPDHDPLELLIILLPAFILLFHSDTFLQWQLKYTDYLSTLLSLSLFEHCFIKKKL